MQLRGCGTALVTPFHQDGSIDDAALRNLVAWQVESGIDFLVPCGTTGETPTLTHDEWLHVIDTTIEVVAGRVPIVAGATSNSTHDAVEKAKEVASRTGVAGILTASPYYNKPTQEGQYRHFKAIAEVGRLTSGPTPALAWHTEGGQINSSDRSVDKITFQAKTLPSLLLISYELLNDMTDSAAAAIENDIIASMALEVDRTCLRGAGTSVEPAGIRNTGGVTLTSLGANGAIPSWDNLVDGVSTLRKANVEPDGIIWSARTQQTLDKQKIATGAYIEPPPGIARIARYVSNQIPDTLTQGASNAASEIYIGAWANLLLGLRQDIGFQILGEDTGPSMGRVMVLKERWADQGLAGLLCFWRGDVQLAHLQAFNVLTGVTIS